MEGANTYTRTTTVNAEALIVKWLAGKRFYCARAEVRLGVGSCVTRVAGPNDVAQLYAKQCSAQLSVLDRRDRGVRWPPRLVATAENRLTDYQASGASDFLSHQPSAEHFQQCPAEPGELLLWLELRAF